MNKEALLEIIINNIKEVETLVSSFKGQENIPSAFLNLTINKLNHINDEMLLLGNFSEDFKANPATDRQEIASSATTIAQSEGIAPNTPIEKIKAEKAVEETPKVESKATKEEVRPEPEIVASPISKEETAPEKEVIKEIKVETAQEVPHTTEPKEQIAKEEVIKEAPKEKKADQSSTLGETFSKEKSSVNDIIAGSRDPKKAKSISGKPVEDIRRAIGINDRFLFQRELFNNSAELLNHTVEQLNGMPNFDAAVSFLTSNFEWDFEDATSESFLSIVKRKFI